MYAKTPDGEVDGGKVSEEQKGIRKGKRCVDQFKKLW